MGEKLAVTRLGMPEMLRVTGELKSLRDETVMVTVLELPLGTETEVRLEAMVKSGASFTVRKMFTVWLRLPLVPVTVMVKLPVVAVELAVRERVEVPGGVTGLGVNEAVTPDGRPDAASVTAPENPATGDRVMVVVPAEPLRYIVTDVGLAEMVKSGLGSTVRVRVVECDSEPLTPVMVIVKVPGAAVAPAEIVSVERTEPPGVGVTGLGVKNEETPVGRPEVDRVTGLLNSPMEVTVIVTAPELSCCIVREDPIEETEKSAFGLTVKETVVDRSREPEVPMIVSVKVPVAAVELAERVRMVVVNPFAGGVAGLTEKVPVTPLGRPDTVKLTAWLKSPVDAIVIVTVPVPPLSIVRDAGLG